MLIACADREISDDFIYTNDDIFVMRPIDPERGLQVCRGPVDELMDRFRARGPLSGHARTVYRTGEYLKAQGVSNPLAYDSLHWPQVFNKHLLGITIRECNNARVKCWATVYGNRHRNRFNVTAVPNAKHNAEKDWPDRAVLSSSDGVMDTALGGFLYDCFQVMSRYEV
jgi:hypothetical protein